ncbi:MAG: tRNA (guanosine(37)-N1)-methyltransferase TrmD [Bacteroidota bacterium]
MRVDIITCQPGLLSGPFSHSIVKRAIEKQQVAIHIHDLRSHGLGKHAQIDDYAYGGGAGMVLMVEPIVRCIEALQAARNYDKIIYMAPDGEKLTQSMANRLSLDQNLMLLCGHYKGVDERIREHFITHEVSIGEYVISGGELAAAIVVDAVVRLIPGVLSDASSALNDSFQDGLLEPPIYTRPASFRDLTVPTVLFTGNAQQIDEWKLTQSIARTRARAPHLLKIDEEEG